MTTNETLRDGAVSHSIGLSRYSSGQTRKAHKLLERVERRIIDRLSRVEISEFNKARLERLLDGSRRIMAGEHETLSEVLKANLQEFATYEAGYQADLFKQSAPVSLELVLPSDDQLWAAVNARPFQGRYLQGWLDGLEATSFARVRNAIRTGFFEGRTTEQIIRDLRGTRRLGFKDGIYETSRREAAAVVRTAITHTAQASRNRLFERNKRLIKGVQWVSTLDGRTSAVCRARDGEVYPVDKGPRPPAHANCRSSTVPMLKSWKELGLKGLRPPHGPV